MCVLFIRIRRSHLIICHFLREVSLCALMCLYHDEIGSLKQYKKGLALAVTTDDVSTLTAEEKAGQCVLSVEPEMVERGKVVTVTVSGPVEENDDVRITMISPNGVQNILEVSKKKGRCVAEYEPQMAGQHTLVACVSQVHVPRSRRMRITVMRESWIHKEAVAIGDVVGRGGYGTVYKATMGGLTVAVKELTDELMTDRFMRSVATMTSLSHPNIVKCFGAVENTSKCQVVLEFLGGGTLRDAVLSGKMSLVDRVLAVLDVATGMHYLHVQDPPILHRDLKTTNVMINEDGV